jgi:hypothetical protein
LQRHEAQHLAEIVEAGARSARNVDCPRCGSPCIRGDDDDRSAIVALVDAEPIDLVGEMLAIFKGLHTFDLMPARGKAKRGAFNLWHREPWNVHSAKQVHPIYVDHVCDPNYERPGQCQLAI